MQLSLGNLAFELIHWRLHILLIDTLVLVGNNCGAHRDLVREDEHLPVRVAFGERDKLFLYGQQTSISVSATAFAH